MAKRSSIAGVSVMRVGPPLVKRIHVFLDVVGQTYNNEKIILTKKLKRRQALALAYRLIRATDAVKKP